MQQVKELRFSFACPVKGLISFGTTLDSIKDGKAQVRCRVCGGIHDIEPNESQEEEEIDEAGLKSMVDRAEKALVHAREELEEVTDTTENVSASLAAIRELLKPVQKVLGDIEAT